MIYAGDHTVLTFLLLVVGAGRVHNSVGTRLRAATAQLSVSLARLRGVLERWCNRETVSAHQLVADWLA